MATRTYSSREFNQSASAVKQAANEEPVFITDRGRPSHVLMSIALYRLLSGNTPKIADLLAMPQNDVDLKMTELEIVPSRELARPADFS